MSLRAGIADTIQCLDRCGVLRSIASRNDSHLALSKLRQLGLEDYFLCPQIGWWPKSESIARIAETLRLGLDTFLFVDDQAIEREAVVHALTVVRTLDAALGPSISLDPQFKNPGTTAEASRRRLLYREENAREVAHQTFQGSSEEFRATLNMELSIRSAESDGLDRAEELTRRTNQLNSTGIPYSKKDLAALTRSVDHRLLIMGLRDRFGDYGQIGLALLETQPALWTLKLLLMSCRVAAHGIGTVVLNYLLSSARCRRGLPRRIPRHRPKSPADAWMLAGTARRSSARSARLFHVRRPKCWRLPLSARAYKLGYSAYRAGALATKPLRLAFRALRALRLCGAGRAA